MGLLAKAFRLYCTNAAASYYRVGEIEVRAVAGGPNLCVGGVAFGDGDYYPANRAFDGSNVSDGSDAWAGNPGASRIIGYDWGTLTSIGEITIYNGVGAGAAQNSFDFEFQYTIDGSTWLTLFFVPRTARVATGGVAVTYPLSLVAVSARYWRVKNIQISGSHLELNEWLVFSTGARVDTLAAFTAQASPSYGVLAHLQDNTSTRVYWDAATATSSSFWLRWEFTTPTQVTSMKIAGYDTPNRYPTGFRVEYSQDGVTWTTCATVGGLAYPGNHTLSADIVVAIGSIYGVAGYAQASDGVPVAGVVVRAYKRSTGELLGSTVTTTEAPALIGDDHYSNVSLLIRANGPMGSSTFVDESPNPKSISAGGGAQIGAVGMYGNAIALPYGSWLSLPPSNAWEWGDGNFTLECYAYFSSNPSSSSGDYGICLFGQTSVATSGRSFFLFIAGSDLSNCEISGRVYNSGGGEYRAGATRKNIPLHTWHHFAMCRDGPTLYTYFNGTLVGSANLGSVSLRVTSSDLLIGRFNDNGYNYFLNGHIDDLRFTKGVCRYVGGTTFTPPVEHKAYPHTPATRLGEFSLEFGSVNPGEVQVVFCAPDEAVLRNDVIHRVFPVEVGV